MIPITLVAVILILWGGVCVSVWIVKNYDPTPLPMLGMISCLVTTAGIVGVLLYHLISGG